MHSQFFLILIFYYKLIENRNFNQRFNKNWKILSSIVLFEEELLHQNEMFTLMEQANTCYWYTVKLLLFTEEIPKWTGFSSVFLVPMQ